jgi:HEAT repeat protein/TolB-like protein
MKLRNLHVAVLLAVLGPTLTAAQQPGPAALGTDRALSTVAVLNFDNRNQGDSTWDWLAKGLADLTIGDLAGQQLRVVSREQMQELINELKFKKQQHDPQAVARVLKASRWVHGSYRVEQDTIHLNATIQTDAGKQLHAAAVSGPTADVLVLQKKLSAELADVLKGNRPGTIDPARLPRWTESVPATQLLYRGVDLFDRGEYLTAWGLFRRALRLDPGYADALYWSGRMMYYVQEYHQAGLDLERFVRQHPGHQRAGDAVMEIIHAAQLTAPDADEVLRVLALAARSAPMAEVHNQFGAGYSSTVGLYAAGLATQILRAQGRHRDAFERLGEQLVNFAVDHPLYWITWHDMFADKVGHLQVSGEELSMPPRPLFPDFSWTERRGLKVNMGATSTLAVLRAPRGLHPQQQAFTPIYGGLSTGDDEPLGQRFIRLSPEKPSIEFDFSAEPLSPNLALSAYTHYLFAEPGQFLTRLDVEIEHKDAKVPRPFVTYSTGDDLLRGPLQASGRTRFARFLPFGTRVVPVRLRSSDATITGWKITAHFCPCAAATGTIVLRGSEFFEFEVSLDGPALGGLRGFDVAVDGLSLGWLRGTRRLERVPAGRYTLRYCPLVNGGVTRHGQAAIDVAAGEEVVVALSAGMDPRRRRDLLLAPCQTRQISGPYPVERLGAAVGEVELQGNEVCFHEDRAGRWTVLWATRRDLYMTTSSDRGCTWSPTAKLPAPVNSAHEERWPVLTQDPEGRFLLAFVSDRNRARARTPYVCWSEDLVNFSAPALICAEPSRPVRVFRRDDGVYLAYLYMLPDPARPSARSPWAVCTSPDLVHWSPPQPLADADSLDVVEDGGRYLAVCYTGPHSDRLQVRTSMDGVHFSAGETVRFQYQEVFPTRLGVRNIPATLHLNKVLNKGPGAITCRRTKGAVRLMVHAMRGVGVVLQQDRPGSWQQIASLGRAIPDEASQSSAVFSRGDFAVGEGSLAYFNIGGTALAHQSFGRGDSYWKGHGRFTQGQPLFQTTYEYVWPALPAEHAISRTLPDVVAVVVHAADIMRLDGELLGPRAEVRHRAACTLALTGRRDVLPLLLEALQSPEAPTRRQALEGLGHVGSATDEIMAAVAGGLRDADPAVRRQAGWTMQELAADGAALVPVLRPVLGDRDAQARQSAVDLLAGCGAAAVPHLIAALQDSDAAVRRAAVESLALLGVTAQEALPAVRRLAQQDPDPALRPRATQIARLLDPDDIAILLELLADQEYASRLVAALALGKAEKHIAQAEAALVAALKHPDPNTRRSAVYALGDLAPRANAALAAVRGALNDPDPGVRYAVKVVLEKSVNR